MARYTGPKTKIARKFGEPIFGDDKSFEKRNYPPGQHGNNRRRGKKSEYAIQLMEKQKAKYTYGILERQFRNMFKKATASTGITGEVLLQLCESRLDNVVYRMGLSNSRRGAPKMTRSSLFADANDNIQQCLFELEILQATVEDEESGHAKQIGKLIGVDPDLLIDNFVQPKIKVVVGGNCVEDYDHNTIL